MFTEFIMFVVIRPGKYASNCMYVLNFTPRNILPHHRAIHTYGNRGTTARHARARDHLVIYSGEKQPELVEGESNAVLDKPPIKVTLDPGALPLRSASRLSLSKVHSVEHTVPAARIGKIAPLDVYRLRQYAAEALGAIAPKDGEFLVEVAEEDEE
jgi:hypothetical protein